jgi:hypothetical protein
MFAHYLDDPARIPGRDTPAAAAQYGPAHARVQEDDNDPVGVLYVDVRRLVVVGENRNAQIVDAQDGRHLLVRISEAVGLCQVTQGFQKSSW